MTPLLLMKTATSMKKEVWIVVGIIGMICFLPMFSVIALAGTNTISTKGVLYNGPADTADTYAYGNCTWWVFYLRSTIDEPIPTTWGNAATWATRAEQDGYIVDNTPSYGAIMQISDVDNGLGHVAFVQNVDPTTGTWTVSQMNVIGWDEVNTQTYSAVAAQGFYFIHQKVGTVSVTP
jgi:surface antigen